MHPASSPALQLFHGGTQVAGCHHVHPPVDAVFGDERVEGVRQHAGEQRGGRVRTDCCWIQKEGDSPPHIPATTCDSPASPSCSSLMKESVTAGTKPTPPPPPFSLGVHLHHQL